MTSSKCVKVRRYQICTYGNIISYHDCFYLPIPNMVLLVVKGN